eukprot:6178228-Pleurochrysis_carterae.AAC.3
MAVAALTSRAGVGELEKWVELTDREREIGESETRESETRESSFLVVHIEELQDGASEIGESGSGGTGSAPVGDDALSWHAMVRAWRWWVRSRRSLMPCVLSWHCARSELDSRRISSHCSRSCAMQRSASVAGPAAAVGAETNAEAETEATGAGETLSIAGKQVERAANDPAGDGASSDRSSFVTPSCALSIVGEQSALVRSSSNCGDRAPEDTKSASASTSKTSSLCGEKSTLFAFGCCLASQLRPQLFLDHTAGARSAP